MAVISKKKRIRRRANANVPVWMEDLSDTCIRTYALGSGRILIENHDGILEYSCEKVRLLTRDGILTVLGEELYLENLACRCVIVCGRIHSVCLPGKGGCDDPQ